MSLMLDMGTGDIVTASVRRQRSSLLHINDYDTLCLHRYITIMKEVMIRHERRYVFFLSQRDSPTTQLKLNSVGALTLAWCLLKHFNHGASPVTIQASAFVALISTQHPISVAAVFLPYSLPTSPPRLPRVSPPKPLPRSPPRFLPNPF